MKRKLTDLVSEVLAKSQTEEGRRELGEERERLNAEALQKAPQREKRLEAPLEAGKDVQEPPEVRPERRNDSILPVVTVREAPEREAGRLAFGGIVDGKRDLSDAQLPLLPAPEGPRVPLLELVDWHGIPTMTRGRGAPLELAVYVGAAILTPHAARAARGRLVTTVRELRNFLFGRRWEASPKVMRSGSVRPGDWKRMRDALKGADRLWLPLDNGDLWRAVAVRRLPPADVVPGLLDRRIIIDVELPPKSGSGPPIDRAELSRLRRESGPRFRAYIAAHSVQWQPGRTRVVSPKAGGRRVWTSNQDAYTILTAEDRRRLAYGPTDKGHRTQRGPGGVDSPWESLSGTVILTRKATTQDGRRGWVIVPKAAAAAIERKATNR